MRGTQNYNAQRYSPILWSRLRSLCEFINNGTMSCFRALTTSNFFLPNKINCLVIQSQSGRVLGTQRKWGIFYEVSSFNFTGIRQESKLIISTIENNHVQYLVPYQRITLRNTKKMFYVDHKFVSSKKYCS